MKDTFLNIYSKSKKFVLERKILSIVIALVLIFVVYKLFFSSSTSTQTSYSIDQVSRQTVVSYLSETGQVAASGNINLNSTVSGQITSIKVKPGDTVRAGDLIATVESSSAYTSLESAKLAYDDAKVSYQKSISPAATTSLLTAQNSLQSSSSSLVKAYSDSLNDIASSYSDMSTILSYLHDSLYLSDINSSQYNLFYYGDTAKSIENTYSLPISASIFSGDAATKFNLINTDYPIAFSNYQSLTHASSNTDLYSGLQKASLTSQELGDALKSAVNLIQYYQDLNNKYSLTINPKSTTYLNNLKTYQNTIDSDMTTLNSDINNIDNLKLSILQQQSNLSDLQNGVSGLDLQSAQIALDQAKVGYDTALNNYDNYFITSPIDGKVGAVSASVGQDATGLTVATIVTDSKFVDLSVSENDVVKMKIGQKATITFDAIDSLSLVGTVSQINQSGVVSSGVVSYDVRVAFDDPSDQVRPGMSASANIVVGIATDVLAVPSSAVKSTTSSTYIDTFNSTSTLSTMSTGGYTSSVVPFRKTVTTGLVGDSYTEITSGLQEGDIVVTKTTGAKTTTTTTPAANASSQRSFGGGSSIGGIRIGG